MVIHWSLLGTETVSWPFFLQVPIRELGWEFPGWDLSHFAKFGIFWVFFKYPKISKNGNPLFFSCVVWIRQVTWTRRQGRRLGRSSQGACQCKSRGGFRRQRRERQKSNWFRLAEQQLCTCITLFSTFLFPRCTTTAIKLEVFRRCVLSKTTTWNCLISHFVEDVNTRERLSFSFSELDTVL